MMIKITYYCRRIWNIPGKSRDQKLQMSAQYKSMTI